MRFTLIFAGTIVGCTITIAANRTVDNGRSLPAIVGSRSNSISSTLSVPETGDTTGDSVVVKFHCIVDKHGKSKPPAIDAATVNAEAFVQAVRRALAAGHFDPASVSGEPVVVEVSASVFFLFGGNRPVIKIFLNQEDEFLSSEKNLISPQLIVGRSDYLTPLLWVEISRYRDDEAIIAYRVSTDGIAYDFKTVRQKPKSGRADTILINELKHRRFIPAHIDGRPVEVKCETVYSPSNKVMFSKIQLP